MSNAKSDQSCNKNFIENVSSLKNEIAKLHEKFLNDINDIEQKLDDFEKYYLSQSSCPRNSNYFQESNNQKISLEFSPIEFEKKIERKTSFDICLNSEMLYENTESGKFKKDGNNEKKVSVSIDVLSDLTD